MTRVVGGSLVVDEVLFLDEFGCCFYMSGGSYLSYIVSGGDILLDLSLPPWPGLSR